MPASTVNSEINFIIILTFKFFLFTQNYVMTFVAHTHAHTHTVKLTDSVNASTCPAFQKDNYHFMEKKKCWQGKK